MKKRPNPNSQEKLDRLRFEKAASELTDILRKLDKKGVINKSAEEQLADL